LTEGQQLYLDLFYPAQSVTDWVRRTANPLCADSNIISAIIRKLARGRRITLRSTPHAYHSAFSAHFNGPDPQMARLKVDHFAARESTQA